MCIITSINLNNNKYLTKNRDRAYKPTIGIIHTIIKNTEIVFLYDYDTNWCEGMNEYGIAVVNSALSVGYDEIEKKIIKKTGKKSKDGKRIIKALTLNNIDDVCNSLMKYENGVRGHTFINDKDNSYAIESTTKHNPILKHITDEVNFIVRTNHGFLYPNAGYQHGKDYKSSKIRKISAENVLGNIDNKNEILPNLRKKFYSYQSNLNMNRDNKLSTTTQLMMDSNNKIFTLHVLKNDIKEFKGIINKLPENYIPKIKIEYKILKL